MRGRTGRYLLVGWAVLVWLSGSQVAVGDRPEPGVYRIDFRTECQRSGGEAGDVSYGLCVGARWECSRDTLEMNLPDGSQTLLDLIEDEADEPRLYGGTFGGYGSLAELQAAFPVGEYEIQAGRNGDVASFAVDWTQPTGFPSLTSPLDGRMDVAPTPTVTWESCGGWADTLQVRLHDTSTEPYIKSLRERLEFKSVMEDNTLYRFLFEEGERVVKLSDTQWHEARSLGYLSDDPAADDLLSKYDTTYTPDANPNVFWLCLEDGEFGGDRDFKDLMARVTVTDHWSVLLHCVKGYTDNTNSIVDTETGMTLVEFGQHGEWTGLDAVVRDVWCEDLPPDQDGSPADYLVDLAVGETSWIVPEALLLYHLHDLEVMASAELPDTDLGLVTLDGDAFEFHHLFEYSDTSTFGTVPEPATLALLGLGAAGLVAARCRRRR